MLLVSSSEFFRNLLNNGPVQRLVGRLSGSSDEVDASPSISSQGKTFTAVVGASALGLILLAKSFSQRRRTRSTAGGGGGGGGVVADEEDPVRYIPGNFLLGALLEIVQDQNSSLGFEKRHMNWEHSEVVRTHFMGETYFLKGPNMIEQYHKFEQNKHAEARWIGPFLKLFGPKSILAVNGKEHLAQRKIVLQSNNAENLSIYFPIAEQAFFTLVKTWVQKSDSGNIVEVQADLNHFANNLNGRFFMGDHMPEADLAKIGSLFAPWRQGFTALPIDLPFTTFGKALKAKNDIGLIAVKEINYRKVNGAPERWDMLQGYAEAVDPATDKPYTDQDLAAMISTLLFGALDTTVGAEAFIPALACQQPDNFKLALIKIRAEINAKRAAKGLAEFDPSKDTSFGLSYSEVFSLPYLKASVEEILRLTGPGPNSARKCIKDMRMKLLDGREFTIPAGANVWIALTVTAWDNRNFTNPLRFDPDRYLPPREESKHVGQYGGPIFGFGARLCPGQAFARVQISLILCVLASLAVEFKAAFPNDRFRNCYNPTLLFLDGVRVKARAGAF